MWLLVSFIAFYFSSYGSISEIIKSLPTICVKILAFLILILVLLYNFQDKLIYMPNIAGNMGDNIVGFRNPGEYDIKYEESFFNNSEGLRINYWILLSKDVEEDEERKVGTILFLQGNSGNMGYRLPFLSNLHKKTGLNIAAVSYRGFSNSEGVPSENGIKKDITEFWPILRKHKNVDPGKVVVYGRSLGGAVAIHLASIVNTEMKGLVLDNTFTSMSEMVEKIYPMLSPFKKWILRNYWPSIELIPALKMPILFVSGKEDKIVPPRHMEALHDAATTAEKTILRVEGGSHEDSFEIAGDLAFAEMKKLFD